MSVVVCVFLTVYLLKICIRYRFFGSIMQSCKKVEKKLKKINFFSEIVLKISEKCSKIYIINNVTDLCYL